jgi:5-methylcytosine-specific restriction endonuclease McrA
VTSALKNKTLVLNKTWQPVHVATVRDAIVLLYKGVARAVCIETYQTYDFDDWLEVPPNGNGAVHSKNITISAPHVIVLGTYDKVPTVSTFSKRNVFKRDKYTCQYCGKQSRNLTIDHVVPKSKGGESTWKNVVTACEPCNKKKADKTPDEAGMRLLNKPYRPNLNISSMIKKQTAPNPIWRKFVGG